MQVIYDKIIAGETVNIDEYRKQSETAALI